MKVRVLLVDDHQMFRDALRTLLERVPDLEVVGETGDGADALRLATLTAPDIVCMDIGMPGMNGVEATRRLMAANPALKVIALSTFAERLYVLDMLAAGAAAYVTKAEASAELLRAIAAVRSNRSYLCPDVATMIAGAVADRGQTVVEPARLGAREQQVLLLVANGHTSTEIATRLNIALSTVEVHRRNIMRKLGLHSVAELTRYVISRGLDRH